MSHEYITLIARAIFAQQVTPALFSFSFDASVK